MNVPYFDLNGQNKSIRAALDRAIGEQLDRGSFCLGPAVDAFEKAFAAYHGAKYALGFNSGTSALHVAARILNLGAEDEVIGRHRVMLISHGLWQRRFGSDPNIVGQTMTVGKPGAPEMRFDGVWEPVPFDEPNACDLPESLP